VAWYDDELLYRYPITVYHAASPQDVEITIPSSWDLFWDNVRSDHTDVKIISYAGTELNWDFTSWDYANRTAVIAIDGLLWYSAGGVVFCYLYWGGLNDDTETPFVPAAAVTGYITLAEPKGRLLEHAVELPGVTTPSQVIGKSSSDSVYIGVRTTPYLSGSPTPNNGRNYYEEIVEIESTGLGVETGGADQAAMYGLSVTRAIQDASGDIWILYRIQAGTDTIDYTFWAIVVSTIPGGAFVNEREVRILLLVRDTVE